MVNKKVVIVTISVLLLITIIPFVFAKGTEVTATYSPEENTKKLTKSEQELEGSKQEYVKDSEIKGLIDETNKSVTITKTNATTKEETWRKEQFLYLISNTDNCWSQCETRYGWVNPTDHWYKVSTDTFNVTFLKTNFEQGVQRHEILILKNVTEEITFNNKTVTYNVVPIYNSTSKTTVNATIETETIKKVTINVTKQKEVPLEYGEVLPPGYETQLIIKGSIQPGTATDNVVNYAGIENFEHAEWYANAIRNYTINISVGDAVDQNVSTFILELNMSDTAIFNDSTFGYMGIRDGNGNLTQVHTKVDGWGTSETGHVYWAVDQNYANNTNVFENFTFIVGQLGQPLDNWKYIFADGSNFTGSGGWTSGSGNTSEFILFKNTDTTEYARWTNYSAVGSGIQTHSRDGAIDDAGCYHSTRNLSIDLIRYDIEMAWSQQPHDEFPGAGGETAFGLYTGICDDSSGNSQGRGIGFTADANTWDGFEGETRASSGSADTATVLADASVTTNNIHHFFFNATATDNVDYNVTAVSGGADGVERTITTHIPHGETMRILMKNWGNSVPDPNVTHGWIYVMYHPQNRSTVLVGGGVATTDNAAPNINDLVFNPSGPFTNNTITVYFSINQSDGEAANASVNWSVDGVQVYYETLLNQADETNASSSLNNGNFSAYENVTVEINATDDAGAEGDGIFSVVIDNYVPTLGSVDINSTAPAYNNTDDDIKIGIRNARDGDGTEANMTNITTQWIRNGTSIWLINAPFEINTSLVTDFSTNATKNYAPFQGGNTTNVSGDYVTHGLRGNALRFGSVGQGTELHVNYGNDTRFDPDGAFSVEVWINRTTREAVTQVLFGRNGAAADPTIWQVRTVASDEDDLIVEWNESDTLTSFTADEVLVDNKWQHIVMTWNTTNLSLYVDGVNRGSVEVSTKADRLGSQTCLGNQCSSLVNAFEGFMDEFKIWNMSLNSTQIEYLNSSSADLFETIPSHFTQVGENWSACVIVNDGSEESAESCTANITVTNLANSAPAIQNNGTVPAIPVWNGTDTVTINLFANLTDDDGDTVPWVNFTLRAPNGTEVISNENGTYSDDDMNYTSVSSYTLGASDLGRWEWWFNTTDGTEATNSPINTFDWGANTTLVENISITSTGTFGSQFTFSADVTGDGKANNMSSVNMAVFYPNGSIAVSAEGTNNSGTYNSTSVNLTVVGNYTYEINATTVFGNSSTTRRGIVINDTIVVNPISYVTVVAVEGDPLEFNVTAYHDSYENFTFSLNVTDELDTNYFTIHIEAPNRSAINGTIHNATNPFNFEVNISTAAMIPDGTFKGNLTLYRHYDNGSDLTFDTLIPLQVGVNPPAGVIELQNSSGQVCASTEGNCNLLAAATTADFITSTYILNNSGGFNLSNCVGLFLNTSGDVENIPGIGINGLASTIEPNSTDTFVIEGTPTTSGTYLRNLDIQCNATDLEFPEALSGHPEQVPLIQLAISAATGGGAGSTGGGGAKRVVFTEIQEVNVTVPLEACGNNFCSFEDNEGVISCNQDCLTMEQIATGRIFNDKQFIRVLLVSIVAVVILNATGITGKKKKRGRGNDRKS